MEALLDEILNAENKKTPSEIQEWMRSIQGSHQTGVMRLQGAPGNSVHLFLSRGNWSPLQLNSSQMTLPQEDMSVKFLPLTAHGMTHLKLLFYTKPSQTIITIESGEASDLIKNPVSITDSYMLVLKQKNAVASILYNGTTDRPHSILISNDTVLDEFGIPDALLQLQNDPSCTIAVVSANRSADAWQELFLRRSFKTFYDRLLERCEMQTGRAIVESFARIMAVFAGEQNIDVSIQKRQWVNDQFFISKDQATYFYKLALGELLDHFSAVIGPRLLAANLREVFSALPSDNRDILRGHAILPEGYLS